MFILLFIVCAKHVSAQMSPIDYFYKGLHFYETDDYTNAIVTFGYIINEHPGHKLYPEALYYLGNCYYLSKQADSSIVIFKRLLSMGFVIPETTEEGFKSTIYHNYLHDACERLSDIYFQQSNYDSSLHFLTLAKERYPYKSDCGNALWSVRDKINLKFANIYMKLGQEDNALHSLLPRISWMRSPQSKEFIILKEIFREKQHVRQQLDSSLTHLYVKDKSEESPEDRVYYFRFLDIEFNVDKIIGFGTTIHNEKDAIRSVRKTNLYKMIKSL